MQGTSEPSCKIVTHRGFFSNSNLAASLDVKISEVKRQNGKRAAILIIVARDQTLPQKFVVPRAPACLCGAPRPRKLPAFQLDSCANKPSSFLDVQSFFVRRSTPFCAAADQASELVLRFTFAVFQNTIYALTDGSLVNLTSRKEREPMSAYRPTTFRWVAPGTHLRYGLTVS